MIIESKKGPTGQNIRHVLCAESDQERDSWVDMLVRYVNGTFNDDAGVTAAPSSNPPPPYPYPHSQNGSIHSQPRTSTSSSVTESTATPTRRTMVTKDLISKANANPIPISQLAQDASTAKFFQSAPLPDDTVSSSPVKTYQGPPSVERQGSMNYDKSRSGAGAAPDDNQLSSSLPTSSNLDAAPGIVSLGQRANSELGYYPDLVDQRGAGGVGQASEQQQRIRERSAVRTSFHPSLSTVVSSPTERTSSPEPSSQTSTQQSSTQSPAAPSGRREVKISGPMGGMPIPAGIIFGSKEHAQVQEQAQSGNDRERKAKSRTFWGFGRQSGKRAVKSLEVN